MRYLTLSPNPLILIQLFTHVSQKLFIYNLKRMKLYVYLRNMFHMKITLKNISDGYSLNITDLTSFS